MYHQLLVSKPKNDMKTQVKDPLSHFLDEGLYAYNYLQLVFYTSMPKLYTYIVYYPCCYGYKLTYSLLWLPSLPSVLPSRLYTATLLCLPSLHYKSVYVA